MEAPSQPPPLSNCRNCGRSVDHGVAICPHCGVSTDSSRRVWTVFRVLGLICLTGAALVTAGLGACFVILGSIDSGTPNQSGGLFLGGLALGSVTLLLLIWLGKIIKKK